MPTQVLLEPQACPKSSLLHVNVLLVFNVYLASYVALLCEEQARSLKGAKDHIAISYIMFELTSYGQGLSNRMIFC